MVIIVIVSDIDRRGNINLLSRNSILIFVSILVVIINLYLWLNINTTIDSIEFESSGAQFIVVDSLRQFSNIMSTSLNTNELLSQTKNGTIYVVENGKLITLNYVSQLQNGKPILLRSEIRLDLNNINTKFISDYNVNVNANNTKLIVNVIAIKTPWIIILILSLLPLLYVYILIKGGEFDKYKIITFVILVIISIIPLDIFATINAIILGLLIGAIIQVKISELFLS